MQGPILAFVYAVKELLGEGAPGAAGPGGSLPCNVVFVVEGEEENGSAGFRDVSKTGATAEAQKSEHVGFQDVATGKERNGSAGSTI